MTNKVRYGSVQNFIRARSVVNEDGCWLWQGIYPYRKGFYPGCSYNKRHYKVHHLSYLAFKGPLKKDGKEMICHTCDVKHCVNPEHLYSGDAWSNYQDRFRNKRINREKPYA